MSWLTPQNDKDLNHWDELEILLAEMRRKQKKRNIEMQEALFRQKVAEFASEMDWWPRPLKRGKSDNKHRIT